MAIGTTAAIIGASVIGAGASALGSSKAAKAATAAGQTSADASNRAADLQFATAQQAREDFEPYRQVGLTALGGDNGLLALLGLDNQQFQATQNGAPASTFGGAPQPSQGFDGGAYMQANPGLMQAYQSSPQGFTNPADFGAAHWENFGDREGRESGQDLNFSPSSLYPQPGGAYRSGDSKVSIPGMPNPGQPSQYAPNQGAGQPSAQNTAQPSSNSPTDALRNTPGWQFRFDEGERAVNNQLAASGLSNSGAAQKALTRYGQGQADQGYQQRVNNLLNMTNIGTGAQAQITNSSQNAAANAGSAIQNGGNALAQSQLNRGSAYQQGVNGVSNAIGWGMGAYGQSKGWFGGGS